MSRPRPAGAALSATSDSPPWQARAVRAFQEAAFGCLPDREPWLGRLRAAADSGARAVREENGRLLEQQCALLLHGEPRRPRPAPGGPPPPPVGANTRKGAHIQEGRMVAAVAAESWASATLRGMHGLHSATIRAGRPPWIDGGMAAVPPLRGRGGVGGGRGAPGRAIHPGARAAGGGGLPDV